MKTQITIILIFWMLFTLILACSFVGWIVLCPQQNNTGYHKHQEELRSTWMRIGYSLKDKLIEK